MPSDERGLSLFARHGEQFVPTALTTGPWRPDAMHGGAASALVGAVVATAIDAGEHVAGLQIDLERPVAIEPLRVAVSRRRTSRRIAHLNIEICASVGRVVAAKVLLLQGEHVPTVPLPVRDPVAASPDELSSMVWADYSGAAGTLFHRDAIEHRIAEGGYGTPGPATAWLRMRGTVVAGQPPSGLEQLMAVADFGSALSQSLAPGSGVGLINVDVNVSLFRAPVGPWFCLQAAGDVSDHGIGLAVTRLHDVTGPLGVVTQSQIAHAFPRAE
jgi:hypothetical protein